MVVLVTMTGTMAWQVFHLIFTCFRKIEIDFNLVEETTESCIEVSVEASQDTVISV